MVEDTNEPSLRRQGFWGTPDVTAKPNPASASKPEPETPFQPELQSEPEIQSEPEPEFQPEPEPEPGLQPELELQSRPEFQPEPVREPATPALPHEGRGYIDDAELIDEKDLLPEVRDGSYGPDGSAGAGNVADQGPGRRGVRPALLAAAVVLLIVAYVLGVRRYATHFAPHTSIGGADVSSMTVAEATSVLRSQSAAYSCTVAAGDFSATVGADECGFARDEARIAADALASQNELLWPFLMLGSHNLEPEQGITVDDELLAQRLGEAVDEYNGATISSEGLSISLDETTGLYSVEGTVSGTALDKDAVVRAARDAMADMLPEVEVQAEGAGHKATVDDLPAYRDSVAWVNAVRTTDIPLLVDGHKVETDADEALAATTELNAELVSIGDGPSVAVDTDALTLWATDVVAPAVHEHDEYTDYKLDVETFVSEFTQRLTTGVVDPYEVPMYDQRRQEAKSRAWAYERGGWDSELGRYIDVDLTAQFARFFDDEGEVMWESAFVSGSKIAAFSTITGTFNIQSKQTDTVLVGFDYDNDGNPDWLSYVNFWMPFYAGYGLHDATWREDFGGDEYYYEGSHGCINLPYEKAAELYDIVEVGDTVSVHW